MSDVQKNAPTPKPTRKRADATVPHDVLIAAIDASMRAKGGKGDALGKGLRGKLRANLPDLARKYPNAYKRVKGQPWGAHPKGALKMIGLYDSHPNLDAHIARARKGGKKS